MSQTEGRRKVAILGGGVGAMTAAFELPHPHNPRAREYDVTVYQMGWRLGGKGASGRRVSPPASLLAPAPRWVRARLGSRSDRARAVGWLGRGCARGSRQDRLAAAASTSRRDQREDLP
ncbi:MAG TPA: NAD(P)-binding protein [Thermoanaerobaculia bacterium]|nr:NAD(P)-binding protein [Thermoanaerobaculia bacterium]